MLSPSRWIAVAFLAGIICAAAIALFILPGFGGSRLWTMLGGLIIASGVGLVVALRRV